MYISVKYSVILYHEKHHKYHIREVGIIFVANDKQLGLKDIFECERPKFMSCGVPCKKCDDVARMKRRLVKRIIIIINNYI